MLNYLSEEWKLKLSRLVLDWDQKQKIICSKDSFQNDCSLVWYQMKESMVPMQPIPFFQHFDLSKLDVTCDGHSVYGKPFEPKFGANQYLRSYLSLYQALASQNQVQNCNIVTKWIKSCWLQCFGTFKMPILMFISILVFRPESQI